MPKITSPKEYISNHPKWQTGLNKLRSLLLKTELVETLKWGMPTYTLNGKNVVGLTGFKEHFGIWFFNGVYLADPYKILVNAQEGKTKALRQLRFSSEHEIDESKVQEYILEAIENQKQGKELKPKKKPLVIPDELKVAFSQNTELADAFDQLTPGCKKEYAEYISEAKKEETRLRRIEKITPMILERVGLHDQYK